VQRIVALLFAAALASLASADPAAEDDRAAVAALDTAYQAAVVRVWGDTAVVTARLWLKGMSGDQPFERRLWFSDTYVRTASGWRYAFGQASLPLPPQAPAPPASAPR
jgi:hypothetical protein